MMASEAGLVEDPGVGSQLVDQVHCLVAGRAFLRRSCKTGHALLPFCPTPFGREMKTSPLLLFHLSFFFFLYLLPFYLQLMRGKKEKKRKRKVEVEEKSSNR